MLLLSTEILLDRTVTSNDARVHAGGRRPDATKVWNFNNNFREQGVGKDWIALPEHFVTNGYLVTGTGACVYALALMAR